MAIDIVILNPFVELQKLEKLEDWNWMKVVLKWVQLHLERLIQSMSKMINQQAENSQSWRRL